MRRGRRGGGLLGTAARTAVIAGTATAVSGRVAHQQDRAQRAAGGEAGAGGAPDRITQLERLDQLRQSGALSEDEFKREKAKLG